MNRQDLINRLVARKLQTAGNSQENKAKALCSCFAASKAKALCSCVVRANAKK
jgi:hypothetical protein